MPKTILITGATDGIGKTAARLLVDQGHKVLLHGRNPDKLEAVERELTALHGVGSVERFTADLSRLNQVEALARAVIERHHRLDVLINNAGVFKTPAPITPDGLDARFAVNTLAPYLLTQRLLPLMDITGRIINVASAGQAPVDLDALAGKTRLADDFEAYCQSKLALIMWTRHLAQTLEGKGPAFIAVNPGSLLGTKMVKQGFNLAGKDIGIGASILVKAALADAFENASGEYFDNDAGRFGEPHRDALDGRKVNAAVEQIEEMVATGGLEPPTPAL